MPIPKLIGRDPIDIVVRYNSISITLIVITLFVAPTDRIVDIVFVLQPGIAVTINTNKQKILTNPFFILSLTASVPSFGNECANTCPLRLLRFFAVLSILRLNMLAQDVNHSVRIV